MADSKQNPYACISKVLNGYDKFIHLKPTDTVVFAEPRYDENEKLFRYRFIKSISKIINNEEKGLDFDPGILPF